MADDQIGKTPKEKSSSLPRIRTYAADMSKVIKTRGETLATIVGAEKRNPEKLLKSEAEQKRDRNTLLFGVGAVALIILGIAAIALVSIVVSNNTPEPEITESIIFPNRSITIERDSEGVSIHDQLATLRAETDMSLGEIARLIVTQNGLPLSPQEFASQFGFPSSLTREVTDIMVGIHAFDRNQPFIILNIQAYDRSFNAMLATEAELGRLLNKFFAPHNTSVSSPGLQFEDAIIRNIDVRQSGDSWPILYSYPERNTLVITTNEFTLREILSRLSNQQR